MKEKKEKSVSRKHKVKQNQFSYIQNQDKCLSTVAVTVQEQMLPD